MKSKKTIGLFLGFCLVAIYFITQGKYGGYNILEGTRKEPDPTSEANGNTFFDSEKGTGSRISEGISSTKHTMKYMNSSGSFERGNTNLKQTKLNMSVVYNVDVLLNEVRNIHDRLYTKPRNESCTVRQAGCVIIGVAKSGTQELLNFLSLHPNVVPKHNLPNPNLFDKDSLPNKRKEKMPCTYSDQVGIVKTDYFFFRDEMPRKFYEFNENLKMILIVREPVERLISAYSFTYLQKKQHKLVFNYKLNDVPEIDRVFVDQHTGSVKIDQFDLSHSVYDVPMEKYLKHFSKEQILVLDSTEFRNEPVEVLQRVERFLGLKPVITNDYFEYNQEKHFYCLKRLKRVFCYGNDRGRAKLKDIKAETSEKLYEYFKPHNERFFNLIGKKFNWSRIR